METFTQPKIDGYRQLTKEDADLMNKIKARGADLARLIDDLRSLKDRLDQRCVSIGATELQTGLMWLTRAVAQPTHF
jgi:hypothetical protein